jgi:hypothetical protein
MYHNNRHNYTQIYTLTTPINLSYSDTQSKLFTGPVNWDIIGKIKDSVDIPVVANGGVVCKCVNGYMKYENGI